MKMTSVSRSMPHSFSFASSWPTLSSMLAIMPKNLATFGPHLARVKLLVFLRHLEWIVRSIERDIGVERFLALHRRNPLDRLGEEDVGAVAVCLLELAVVEDGRVEIGVAGRVAATAGIRLADAAGAVNEDFVKAAPVGLVGQLRRRGAICRRCRWCSRRPCSTCASVVAFSVSRSRSRMVCVTPLRNSCRPVINAARVGEQVGLTWKSVKRTA